MQRVLLAGCGNIGFRHLQALCTLDGAIEIHVIEPNVETHQRILDEFDVAAGTGHQFSLERALPTSSASFDLVVVASRRRNVG